MKPLYLIYFIVIFLFSTIYLQEIVPIIENFVTITTLIVCLSSVAAGCPVFFCVFFFASLNRYRLGWYISLTPSPWTTMHDRLLKWTT